jgi:hypothetical protein
MKGQTFGWKYIVIILGLAVLASLVMDFNSRMADLRRLAADREVVAARATQVVQTGEALEAQIAYATSDAAVERWAYEDAHMVREGDQPVAPIAEGMSTPAPTPTLEPQPTQAAVWEEWWTLFFGPKTP